MVAPIGKQSPLSTQCYSYTDLEDFTHERMKKEGVVKSDKTYGINLTFVLSSFKVVIELDQNYQLDFRGSKFGELIGFDPKLITKTEYGSKLPNITNSIDVINVNCDAITDSLVDGQNSNTITVIPTD